MHLHMMVSVHLRPAGSKQPTALAAQARRNSLLTLQMKGNVNEQFWSFQPHAPVALMVMLALPTAQYCLRCAPEPQLP